MKSAIGKLFDQLKDGTFQEILEDWKWIFRYSVKYKGAIVLYVLMGLLSTSLGIVGSIAGKYVIDIVTGYRMDQLGIVVAIMIGSALSSLIFENMISRLSLRISIFIHQDIQVDIFDKIMDADWLSLNGFSNGDIINRFNNDIGTVSNNAVSWLPTLIIATYRFAATFFVILHYDRTMAVIALAGAPILLLVSRYFVKRQREYGKKMREMSSKLMTFEVESFYNIDTIKSFGIASLYTQKLRGCQDKWKQASLDYNKIQIQMNVIMSSIGSMIQFVAFLYCVFRLWTGDITYGTMTLFLQQRTNLSNAFEKVVGIVPSFLNSSISAHRIRELVELPKEVHVQMSDEKKEQAKKGVSVRVNEAEFSYFETKEPIHFWTFQADPGEIVALIGPSGEGKTTMLRLLLGLIRPQKGNVVLYGDDFGTMEMNAEVRQFFSYVPQGNTILSGTIEENLRMVKEDAREDELIFALKMACAWEFVEKMPDGIRSSVGERGKGLSEGQAQRLSIARALLREAPILLLDEATSALDVATERKVLRNIKESCPNKICIVTTHRPSVLHMCQRVYRIMDGELKELSSEEAQKAAMDF